MCAGSINLDRSSPSCRSITTATNDRQKIGEISPPTAGFPTTFDLPLATLLVPKGETSKSRSDAFRAIFTKLSGSARSWSTWSETSLNLSERKEVGRGRGGRKVRGARNACDRTHRASFCLLGAEYAENSVTMVSPDVSLVG